MPISSSLKFALVIISIIYLLFNYSSVPWVGLIVGITWSAYSFLRKKINVESSQLSRGIQIINFTPHNQRRSKFAPETWRVVIPS